MSNAACHECEHQVEELEQEMAEVQRLLSDKEEQEGAMLQVCICTFFVFAILHDRSAFRLSLIQILKLINTYEGLDAGGARTKGNRRCTKIC